MKNASNAAASANGRSSRVKIGELFIVMDGMRVDPKVLLTNSNRSAARYLQSAFSRFRVKNVTNQFAIRLSE